MLYTRDRCRSSLRRILLNVREILEVSFFYSLLGSLFLVKRVKRILPEIIDTKIVNRFHTYVFSLKI